jgi:hypothetical protein
MVKLAGEVQNFNANADTDQAMNPKVAKDG